MAQRKFGKQAQIEFVIRTLGIIQQLAAAGHHHQQSTPGSMVMLVLGKVLSEVGNAFSQHSHLETGRAGVFLINLEVVDVDVAHVFDLVGWLIVRGYGESTLQGAAIVA